MHPSFMPRDSLKTAVLSLLGLGFLATDAAIATQPLTLTILHVNDTHAFAAGISERGVACDDDAACFGGFARLAAAIGAEKKKGGNVLAFDAGDRWQGTLFFSLGGPKLIDRMHSMIEWDAMAIGNHEWDKGPEALAESIRSSRSPMLAANLRRNGPVFASGCALSDFSESELPSRIVKTINGVKVGIFGLASLEGTIVSKACMGAALDPYEETARREVKRFKDEGVDVIIALTHEGYLEDVALARAVPGIDVIVGGHTHSLLGTQRTESEGPYPTVVRSAEGEATLVVQAKRSTEYLGRLVVSFDEAGRPAAWTGEPVRLVPGMPKNSEIDALVHRTADAIERARAVRITTNPHDTVDGLDPCRWGDCLTGMLTVDAVLEYARPYGATIGLVNGGAIRSALPVGEVDRGSLQEIHPFANPLAVLDVKGEDLLAALENGLNDPDVEGPHLLLPAGLRYTVNAKAPIGSRLGRAEVREGDRWVPIEPEKHYRVATLGFLAEGGDGFTMLARSKHVPAPEALEIDMLEAYLKRFERVPMPDGPRITGMPRSPEARRN